MVNLCVIPARMGSSRYPGKPLKKLMGLELVLHVYERCCLAKRLDRVVVATCDTEIKEICNAHGAEVVMTAKNHPGAVDRTAETVGLIGKDLHEEGLVLMVQGDEILVAPDMIDPVVGAFETGVAPVINLASPIEKGEDHDDPNVVKVAFDLDGRALFFSRAPIPSRTRVELPIMYQQTGVIGFSRVFLSKFLTLDRTPLEITEGIDMLRALEHGYKVQIVTADRPTIGIDTPEEKKRVEKLLVSDLVTQEYL